MATTKKYKNEKPLDLNPDPEFIKDKKREKSAYTAAMLMRALAEKIETSVGGSSPYYLSKEGFDELTYAIVSVMELYCDDGWEKFIFNDFDDEYEYEKMVLQAAIDEFEDQLDKIDTNKGEV